MLADKISYLHGSDLLLVSRLLGMQVTHLIHASNTSYLLTNLNKIILICCAAELIALASAGPLALTSAVHV